MQKLEKHNRYRNLENYFFLNILYYQLTYCIFRNFYNRYVTCCCFSSDGRLLATGSNDRTVLIWSLDGLKSTAENGEGEADVPEEGANEPELTGPCVGASIATVAKWCVDEVCEWLSKIGLPQYEDIFRENEIDGQELLHLNHETLNNIFRIGNLLNTVIYGNLFSFHL